MPVDEPVIDPELNELPLPLRIIEVCRYQLLRMEQAVSKGGHMRVWLRINAIFALALLIPVLMVMPVLIILLGSAVTLTAYLLLAATNLLYAVLALIAAVTALLVFMAMLKAQLGGGRGRRR